MNDLTEKLNALMQDPQLMQQISSMTQAMTAGQKSEEQSSQSAQVPDPGMMQMLSGFAGQTNIDCHQQALLQALSPYLCANRVQKLERAMRAARLAGTASAFLNNGGLQMLTGR